MLMSLALVLSACVNTPPGEDIQGTVEAVVGTAIAEYDASHQYIDPAELEASQEDQNEIMRQYIGDKLSLAISEMEEVKEVQATATAESGIKPIEHPTLEASTDGPCTNAFEYVSDINVPDGTKITRDTVFKKSWYIKNTGTCTWNDDYKLAYNSGKLKGTSDTFSFLEPNYFVKPGESVVVSAEFQAPNEINTEFSSFWSLMTDDGKVFGSGPQQNVYLSVRINVSAGYSFVENFNAGTCSDDYGYIVCGAASNGSSGAVYYDATPMMESHYTGLPSFIVEPTHTEGGSARVEFGPIRMPAGTQFYTAYCCRPDTPHCDVNVSLKVREAGRTEEYELKSDRKYNDGLQHDWKFVLSDYGYYNQDLYFIFEVTANGGGDGEDAIIFQNAYIK